MYDSGWYLIAVFVAVPVGALLGLWVLIQTVVRSVARGVEYRAGDADFVGVGPMIGLNLFIPGTGLMAGGYHAQGVAFLVLWAATITMGVRHATLLERNLTVLHLAAGIWAALQASREVAAAATREREHRREALQRVNLRRQKVPTLEDPDHYVHRLEAMQLVLEAAANPKGRFDGVQTATVNRLRNLLRVEDRTFARMLEQLRVQGDAGRPLGQGARMGPDPVFDHLIPVVVDHPAFASIRDPFLEVAASLLGIPAAEARERREAYERGEEFASGSQAGPLLSLESGSHSQDAAADPSGEDPTEFGHDDPTRF